MRAVWIVLICLGALALILLLASYIVMRYACRRGHALGTDLDKELRHSSFRHYKDDIVRVQQWLKEQPVQEVFVTSYDGLRLRARYIPCENARATLLLFHGWRSYPELDFGAALTFYQSFGVNILLPDERAQGESEGKFITFGVRERHDVHTWVQWCAERSGAAFPLLLGGVSMGATTVLMACGEPFAGNVRGVIADCGFTSPWDIIGKCGRDFHVPSWLLLPPVDLQASLFAGFSLREYSTLDAMKTTKIPTFLAHGEKDTFVPCEMSKRNYAACAAKDKTLLLTPEAGHGQSYLKQTERYQNAVRAFLGRCLGG